MKAKIAYLQRLARRWGGSLVLVDDKAFAALPDTVMGAPFIGGHALCWETKTVYVVEANLSIPAIIHELGHVFATKYHPSYRQCDELTWLGWEYLLARRLRVVKAWRASNRDYGLGRLSDYDDLGDLDPRALRTVLTQAIALSEQHQIIQGNRLVPHPSRREKPCISSTRGTTTPSTATTTRAGSGARRTTPPASATTSRR